MRFAPRDFRRLADHLEARAAAPSLDGYELVEGLRAAADLLEGKPGPEVHPDMAAGSDAFRPRLSLAVVARSVLHGDDDEECSECAGTGRYGFRDDDECPHCHGSGRRSATD